MGTITDFVQSHGLKMRATRVDRNPHMDDMPAGSSHWRCTISGSGRRMIVSFPMGPAHTEPPTIASVLDCLASDAAGLVDADDNFELWCADFGYDSDSRKALRTFNAVKRQAASLRRMLGDSGFHDLLYETSRD